MFTIVTTGIFFVARASSLRKHPELQARFTQVVNDLHLNPFSASLAYHHLGGKHVGLQAVSLTGSYRITLTVVFTEKEIILLDIGSHDGVYR